MNDDLSCQLPNDLICYIGVKQKKVFARGHTSRNLNTTGIH